MARGRGVVGVAAALLCALLVVGLVAVSGCKKSDEFDIVGKWTWTGDPRIYVEFLKNGTAVVCYMGDCEVAGEWELDGDKLTLCDGPNGCATSTIDVVDANTFVADGVTFNRI